MRLLREIWPAIALTLVGVSILVAHSIGGVAYGAVVLAVIGLALWVKDR